MPRTGIMLCFPFEEKRLNKWTPPFIIQPKLDGDRCRAIVGPEGDVVLLSSEENMIVSVPHINEALKNLHLRNVELDGELYIHGAPHEAIHSIVSRTENLHPDYKLAEFHIFDIVSDEVQITRSSKLIDIFPAVQDFGPLQRVSTKLVESLDEIMQELDNYSYKGYEGFVLRNIEAPYVRKRSINMMKFKPRKEDIYEIIGYEEEISKDKVPKGTLGSLLCRGNDETTFSVGSGSLLTREAREKLWAVRETLIGKWARVKYQHMTSARGVPRFPVVVEIL